MDVSTGFTAGLVIAAFLLGLRHGIDWDHIVAISDIAATQESKRRGFFVGTLYVLGHASVVILLGIGAIALGSTIPDWLDAAAGRIVGVTLIGLGLVVVVTLILERGSFRARSRWMILFDASRKVRGGRGRSEKHTHEHVAVESGHHDGSEDPVDGTSMLSAPTHAHEHSHLADDQYTNKAAVGIGAIHGVGAETPTQVVVFLAAASAGGVWAGLAVLFVFVVGLAIANTAITTASVFGFSLASRSQSVQIGFGVFTAAMSIGIGVLFLTGNDAILPAFFAG
ncbi:MAG: DNA repair protein [Acidimicrobiia bacterium]|nr:MAG: DNA repair protein [Acidimicrobiia bacterium]